MSTVPTLSSAELTLALEEQRVLAVYQPCFELTTGRIVAVEALARVQDADTGLLLPPSAFLPTAEHNGLVGRIDAAVAEQAIPQVATWRNSGIAEHICLAVNASVQDLDDDRHVDLLLSLATGSGLRADALVVEITETVLSGMGRGHEQVLARLVDAGCNVTLDDFGTGNNSLAYLQRFEVQGLKIDRSFVRLLGLDHPREQMIERFITFCLGLGVHVVAEGVENADQLEALRALGCPFGQGFLLGVPGTAEQLHQLLVAGTSTAPALSDQPAARDQVVLREPVVTTRRSVVPRPTRPLRRWGPRSARTAPVVALLVATLLAALAVATVNSQGGTERSLLEAGQDRLHAADVLVADTVDERLTALADLVTAQSRMDGTSLALRQRDPASMASVLTSLRLANTAIFSSSLYDASGTLLALEPSAPAVVGRNFAYRDWYRGAVTSSRAYLSEAFQLLTPKRPWAVASASAVRDANGRVIGVVVATFDLTGLQTYVDTLAIDHDIRLTIVGRSGTILASPSGSAVPAGAKSTDPRLALAAARQASGSRGDVQWSVEPLPSVGGRILAEQHRTVALAGYDGRRGQDAFVVGVLLLAAMLLLAVLLGAERARRRLLGDLQDREAFLDSVLAEVDAGVTACDPTGVVTYTNTSDHEGRTLLTEALSKQRPLQNVEVEVGSSRRLQCSARPMRDHHGKLLGAVMVTHDITDLDRQRRKLREAHAWVSALLEGAPSAVVITSADGLVQIANQACLDLLADGKDVLPGTRLSSWLSTDCQPEGLARLERPDGDVRFVEVRTQSMTDPRDRTVLLHSLVDVTPHREEQDRLRRRGHTDPLTGLANRFALEEALARLLETPGHPDLAVVFLDLDGFKSVNDTLGHAAGDVLLAEVAASLEAALRPTDLVARFGGDEFVVLAGIANPLQERELRQRLARAVLLATASSAPAVGVHVGVSMGVAYLGHDGRDAATLLAVADRRMYDAKRRVPPQRTQESSLPAL